MSVLSILPCIDPPLPAMLTEDFPVFDDTLPLWQARWIFGSLDFWILGFLNFLLRGPGKNLKLFLGNDWAQGPRPTLKSQGCVLRGPGTNPKPFLGNEWAQAWVARTFDNRIVDFCMQDFKRKNRGKAPSGSLASLGPFGARLFERKLEKD